MTDARVDWIVARLRLEATYAAAEAIDGPVPVERIVFWQAADEIERLRAELAGREAPNGILCGRPPSRLRLLWWRITDWILLP